MKILLTGQIRDADEYTIREEPVRSVDLMERAAEGLSGAIRHDFATSSRFRIFAGCGNNGGDGIALARMLAHRGKMVSLHLLKPDRDLSPDARINLERLPELENLEMSILGPDDSLPGIQGEEVVIDALFGSGLTREPEGNPARIIDHINRSDCKVIAVDLPSGLFGDDNRTNSRKHVVKATVTYSFQIPKLAFFLPENQEYVGRWSVIPIGLHPKFIENCVTPWHYTCQADVADWLTPRSKFDHKGRFGHAILFCGSTGKMGAAILAARAAIRSGCGLLTMHIPAGGNAIIQMAVPESMTIPDPDPGHWSTVGDLSRFTAAGAGPGIGLDPQTWSALSGLLSRSASPLVLDADALNLLAANPGSLLKVPQNSILTPHPGEYNRLFGEDPDDLTRLNRLRELAGTYRLVIVLKGAHTAVAGPDGSVWFNTTGNPGMAKGGSGDVLTGIITSLLARGLEPFTAARLGVYLHGLAGDLAAGENGLEALTAGDIINHIGPAFNRSQKPSI
ncbi:MAG: NAD(P)H-hydrate dehydratase [Bacteroidales bacterium]